MLLKDCVMFLQELLFICDPAESLLRIPETIEV